MADVTAHGYPFPEPADPMTDYPALAELLAELLDDRSAAFVDATGFAALTPADGDQVTLVDSLTAPTFAWELKYRTAIADAYKWVCLGGAPALVEVATNQTTASAAYVDLATVLSFTVPRAGLYDLHHGLQIYTPTLDVFVNGTLKLGAAAAADTEAVVIRATAGAKVSTARLMRRTLAAADVVKQQYRVASGGGTMQAEHRWMAVRPFRVS